MYVSEQKMNLSGKKKKKICLPLQDTCVPSLSWEDPLEQGMATYSRILAWEIPWTEEPGGLQSMGCKESDSTDHTHTHTHTFAK